MKKNRPIFSRTHSRCSNLDSLRNPLPFKPLLNGLTTEDFDMFAEHCARIFKFHTVYSDAPHSERLAEAFRKYQTPKGYCALVVGIYSSSWLTMRKMMNRVLADMDRGKIEKKTPVHGLVMFTFSDSLPAQCSYFFRFNQDFFHM